MSLVEVDPRASGDWNELLVTAAGASFFHSAHWARVLTEAYGFAPHYFVEAQSGRLSRLLPAMEANSPLTGRRGVSLPFSDYCPPLLPEAACTDLPSTCEPLLALGRDRGWSYLEFRGDGRSFWDVKPRVWFEGHTLLLDRSQDQLFASLRSNYRQKIRRAVAQGVVVEFHDSMAAMEQYFQLHCRTRQRQGVPPQPWRFFSCLQREVVASGMGVVGLAMHGSHAVAGQVLVHFNGKAIYKFGAVDLSSGHTHAAFLLMWEAICHAMRLGCHEFCFGRTDPDQEGLLQFKDGWGAQRRRLNCYRYDMRQQRFMQHDRPSHARSSKLLAQLPLPVLKAAGSLIYPHMG
jgi:hypothetical protein